MLQSQKNLRGIAAMMIAMLFFVGNDALMKLARGSLETGQALFVRGLFALAMLTIVISVTRAWRLLPLAFHRLSLLRSVTESVVAALYISALSAMALADITAILMLTPLILTALSVFFLREKVGWRRWSAVIIGFIGILLVIRPGGQVAPIWAVAMAFGSAVLVAVRDVMTRRMPTTVPSLMLTLATTLGTMVGGAAMLIAGQSWQPLGAPVLMVLAGAAFLVLIGNFAIIEAFRDADISAVSPFRYSVILWAGIFGFALFGEVPTALSLVGLALVIASGLYTVHRERVRQRQETETAAAP
jgi:drug/metabolite transporter (DMT)-like permease